MALKKKIIFIFLLSIVIIAQGRVFDSDFFIHLNAVYCDSNNNTNKLIDSESSNCQECNYLDDTVFKDTVLPKPFRLDAICDCNSIVWHWGGVDKAKGYKINFVNDINSATNLFSGISFTQQKLASNKIYNLYVWAYNDSLISEALHIEARTLALTCGCMLYDERDNEEYKTVLIGNQCWMAQNLNFKSEKGSSCYNDDDKLCDIYGRFYSFEAAVQSCPSGWRLPTKADIDTLILNSSVSTIGLYNIMDNNGVSGFSMKLGGHCDYTCDNPYRFIGKQAGIWTSTLQNSNTAYMLFFTDSVSCMVMKGSFGLGFYVRCIKE